MSRLEKLYENFVFDDGQDQKLLQLLKNPTIKVSPVELPDFWQRTEIVFSCKIPKPFEDGAWKGKNIRGGFGRQIYPISGGNRGLARNFPPWLALFETNINIYGQTTPVPLVFSTSRENNIIDINLTLFGFAELWRDQVIEALYNAFKAGIRPSYFGWSYPSWEVVDWYWYRKDGFTPPKPRQNVLLEPLTPLKLGGRFRSKDISSKIFDNLLQRLTGLGRWMGVGLHIETTDFFNNYRTINVQSEVQRMEDGYARFSERDRQKILVSIGKMDVYRVCNIPKSFWPLLWLGQSAHMGRDVTHGFGRYRLLV